MKGTEILAQASEELKKFIIYELGLLCSAKKCEKNADGDITCNLKGLTMDVLVSDTEGNDYQERRSLERLIVNEKDGTFFVEVEDDREYYLTEIDLYVLANIANMLENDYKRAIGKIK